MTKKHKQAMKGGRKAKYNLFTTFLMRMVVSYQKTKLDLVIRKETYFGFQDQHRQLIEINKRSCRFRNGDPNYGSEFGIWSKVGFGSRSGLPVGLGS